MILDWYKERGIYLKDWDSIAVVQWDTLVLGNIKKQLPGIRKNEIFISGIKILNSTIKKNWNWIKEGSQERNNYLKFKKYIFDNYKYKGEILCSLFIFQVFSKKFFNKWLTVKNKKLGMLEYKIPTYAKIFNIPIYKRNLGVWFFNKNKKREEMPMNARRKETLKKVILSELKKKNGFRIFHPYFKKWNFKE